MNGGNWRRFMPNWYSRQITSPYFFLIFGVVSISAAVIFTHMGRVWVRFTGWLYRAEKPVTFWGEIAVYYFVGVCFIAYFLYLIN